MMARLVEGFDGEVEVSGRMATRSGRVMPYPNRSIIIPRIPKEGVSTSS